MAEPTTIELLIAQMSTMAKAIEDLTAIAKGTAPKPDPFADTSQSFRKWIATFIRDSIRANIGGLNSRQSLKNFAQTLSGKVGILISGEKLANGCENGIMPYTRQSDRQMNVPYDATLDNFIWAAMGQDGPM